MKELTSLWISMGLVFMVIGIRVMAGRFLKEERSGARLGLTLGMFGIYTGILLLFLYSMYLYAMEHNMGTYELYQSTVLVIIGTNIAAVFAGIMYWGMRRKRKISEMDKARLKDL